jgi:glycosyltransferase involved in cell wall biosynthesis
LTTEPLVSVVIPVLNGERHLEACISSVLGQTYSNIEVVVADQASTDRSIEIIKSFGDPRVRILPEPTEQLDLHSNWARGTSAATGELVKIVCHDDVLLPDCLSVQVELLNRYPTAVLACARRRIIDGQDKVLINARGLGPLVKNATRVIGGPALAQACTRAGANLLGEPASVLIRRSALPEPLFNPRWHYTIDVEFYLRCLKEDDAVLDSRVLCCFRVSPQQLSAVLAKGQAKELHTLFSELARRYPDEISKTDVWVGTRRAQLLAQARKMLYWQMRLGAALAAKH